MASREGERRDGPSSNSTGHNAAPGRSLGVVELWSKVADGIARIMIEISLRRPELLIAALALLGLIDVAIAWRRRGAAAPRSAADATAIRLAGWTALLAAAWLAQPATGAAAIVAIAAAAAAAVLLAGSLYSRGAARFARSLWLARAAVLFVALLLIVRPTLLLELVELRRPPLVVLLDDSRSMGLVDGDESARTAASGPPTTRPIAAAQPSRAARVNAALAGASATLAALAEQFDVRLVHIGDASGMPSTAPAHGDDAWRIEPRGDASALSAALRRAIGVRNEGFEHPACVLLVSDGAENVEPPDALPRAAAELGERGAALIAIGVGPGAAAGPRLVMEPLSVPAQISARDRLAPTAAIRATALSGRTLQLSAGWDGQSGAQADLRIDSDDASLSHALDVPAATPGLHRLTVRAAVEAEIVEQHAIVEVREGRIRILMIEAAPRQETAFLARVLAADPRFELERLFAPAESGPIETATSIGADAFSTIDVAILDRVPRSRLASAALQNISHAVLDRGMGLMITGGSGLAALRYAGTELEDLSPIRWPAARPRREPSDVERRLQLTEAGRRHAIFALPSIASDELGWEALPDVHGAGRLPAPKPLAEVLVADDTGAALLAVHEVGRGRAAVVGWDACWQWALASEPGRQLHAGFWRQFALWLAHRRPHAWVLPDESEYVLDALRSGGRGVKIRAGVTGLADGPEPQRDGHDGRDATDNMLVPQQPSPAATQPRSRPSARLRLTTPGGETLELPLHNADGEWHAELQRSLPDGRPLAAGDYDLHFETDAPDGETLSAESRFRLLSSDVETLPPTANLELLRSAAERTAAHGGRYAPLNGLEPVLRELLANDRREKSTRRIEYDVFVMQRWPIFLLLVAALTIEWALRKRAGLV